MYEWQGEKKVGFGDKTYNGLHFLVPDYDPVDDRQKSQQVSMLLSTSPRLRKA